MYLKNCENKVSSNIWNFNRFAQEYKKEGIDRILNVEKWNKKKLTSIKYFVIRWRNIDYTALCGDSRMKSDPRDPACMRFIFLGRMLRRETPSHAYEDKDNRNTFQGLRRGCNRRYGGNKTATRGVQENLGAPRTLLLPLRYSSL